MKKAVLLVAAAFGIALIFAALAFFVPGLLWPTLEYESRVAVDLPRDRVWEKFNDESKMSEWLTGLQSIELIEGERGKPGSRYKLIIENEGERVEILETMKEIRPPGLYSFTLEAEPLVNEVTVTFNEADGKTEIVQKEAVTGKTLVWRSLFYWLQSTFQRNSKQNLINFKQYAEGSSQQ